MVRKVVRPVPEDMLQGDLEKYRKRAIELGAVDAKVITSDMVFIDERVRAKCYYPKCYAYNTNANCPPHTMPVDQIRKVIQSYRYGIFTRIQVPGEEIAGRTPEAAAARDRSQLRNHELVSKIEAEAFYDGYYLALAFANGPCRACFCPGQECSALAGKGCRHPVRSRASMEGEGMDVFRMAANVGWEVYPVGKSLCPGDVPHGVRLGLIMID